jgi:methyltransferase
LAPPITLAPAILAFATLERLGELVLSARNTRRLKAQGAYEVGAAHYPLIVALHAAWLAGLWLLGWSAPVNLAWLAVFAALQLGRLWVLATLGPRWTTRIIVLPGAPLVGAGPYRFVAHPNYLVVIGEIAVLPLALGLTAYAALFTALNAVALWLRIRTENEALRLANRRPSTREAGGG